MSAKVFLLMKTIAIGSFFVLFVLVAGLSAAPAFADHATATVSVPAGSSVPGCEETNECYIPYEVTIDVGGEVTWVNDDSAAHTVTSGTPADGPDGLFDSSLFMSGAEFSVKFDDYKPDDYPYFCMVHPWMQGIVAVQAAGAEDEHMEDEGSMVMQGDPAATGMLSDGTKVSLWATKPMQGERMKIDIEFANAQHVNYDTKVTQSGQVVLDEAGAHKHEGKGIHETAPLNSGDPVNITVTFQGYGVEKPFTGPIGEKVVFSKVVPEFGTIAALILAAAIISIVAFSAKSKLSIIPRY